VDFDARPDDLLVVFFFEEDEGERGPYEEWM
jgi:hypothetical protein